MIPILTSIDTDRLRLIISNRINNASTRYVVFNAITEFGSFPAQS